MDFESVFRLLLEKFDEAEINFALIGGFALHAAGYSRATNDIDFLVSREDMYKVKEIMISAGYKIIHESEDVSNFWSDISPLGNVDFLHAYRKYSTQMLERAVERSILNGKYNIKVVVPEDIIGLKIQSSVNDPERYHLDMSDIESILRIHTGKLNLDLIREYFELFDKVGEFEEIMDKVNNA